MILAHIADDFYLQGKLAKMKQKATKIDTKGNKQSINSPKDRHNRRKKNQGFG